MAKYLIFNKERSIGGGLANWWKPGERGYTYRIEEAGRYSEEDAKRIVENSRGGDLMISEADVVDGKLTTYTIIDLDVDNNLAEIEKMGKESYAATEPASASEAAQSCDPGDLVHAGKGGGMLKTDTCRYFNGLINERCDCNVLYEEVRVESGISEPPMSRYIYPCVPPRTGASDTAIAERAGKCPECSYPTLEEEDADRRRVEERLLERMTKIANGICPNHDRPIEKVRVGQCVYAHPCGCRLYQGEV